LQGQRRDVLGRLRVLLGDLLERDLSAAADLSAAKWRVHFERGLLHRAFMLDPLGLDQRYLSKDRRLRRRRPDVFAHRGVLHGSLVRHVDRDRLQRNGSLYMRRNHRVRQSRSGFAGARDAHGSACRCPDLEDRRATIGP